MIFGAIEAGGTKFVVAVGDEKGQIIERASFKTREPQETMAEVVTFLKKYQADLKGIGVGSFGPIDIRKNSATYGYITHTPKVAWRNYNFVGHLKKEFDVPIAFTTDVNASAFGEVQLGAARDLNSCLYMTIGTGIGCGAIVSGEILTGLSHPEMGHILVRRNGQDRFAGICPSHSDCLEGLASGKAIQKRWGKEGKDLADNDAVWRLEAYYIAQALMNYILILSPERLIIGGGVTKQQPLLSFIRSELKALINGYIELPNLEKYVVLPKLGDDAAITGCLLLANLVKD
ncbi:ROK family protein [Listeria sp. PSOL-1]|uniref:ROK family protein n=1 Tax=Listeria sp. PSOL-1 TaxID=1844999 RepID=UPI0013D18E14|nr:ROK family protein [Listeria sp. PSOL-1]